MLRGDFLVEAHNNATLPARFTFSLSKDNTTLMSETKEVAGGETARWSQPFDDGHAYQFELAYTALSGGGAGVSGQLRPKDCTSGDAVLRMQGEFLPDGRPSVGGGGQLTCDDQTMAIY